MNLARRQWGLAVGGALALASLPRGLQAAPGPLTPMPASSSAPAVEAAAPDLTRAQRHARARAWFTDAPLVDQDQRHHAFYADLLAPRAVLISAGFVSCSSACPLLTQQLVKVRDALGPAFERDIWFLTITVDPLNDGPAELKRFAQRQGADGPGWRFLTGPPAQVQQVLKRLGLWVNEPDAHQTTLIAGRAASGRFAKLRPDGGTQALVQQLARFLVPA